MCGITGLISTSEDLDVTERLISRMADALVHRGPDEAGVEVFDAASAGGPLRVGLGHRRLSIIDLKSGQQPMSNEDGAVWIVYNGECYNFQELRPWLVERGHAFRTRCDTEVLVHLYEEVGPEMVERLRGMFAFAVWDRRNRTLFAARDRLGQKPLFYWHDPKLRIFGFASELKALLTVPGAPREVSPRAIHDYLTYQYVPHPQCIIEGMHKLPPAHCLKWKNGQVTTWRYWRPEYRPDYQTSPHVLSEQLRETLTEATRIRLISDVPLGAFLSGGIDSSLVVALMTELTGGPVKTFSIGFREKAYDETSYAQLVAERYRSDHYREVVVPRPDEVIPRLAWHYDEPFADSSAIPTWYVSRHARRHVTVALTGDAGDETFAGYNRYMAALLSLWIDRLGAPAKAVLRPQWLGAIPGSNEPRTILRRLKRFAYGLSLDMMERYLRWIGIFSEADKKALYRPAFAQAVEGESSLSFLRRYYEECGHGDPVHRITYTDLMTYLPCDINTKVDIASMANSLETRSPFLDHKLVELAGMIPIEHKLRRTPRGFVGKYILKKTFGHLLPGQILHRSKMGFGVPIAEWFRNELRPLAEDVLTGADAHISEYFEPRAVRELVDHHVTGRQDNGYRLWTLLMLELWHRRFVDGRKITL